MELSDLVKVYDGIIRPEMCEDLIKKYDAAESYERYENETYKFNQIGLMNTPGLEQDVVQMFDMGFGQYRKWLEAQGNSFLPETSTLEQVRIKKYATDGYFKEHVDSWDNTSSKRFLSAFVYLNDQGGTKFFDKVIKAKSGRMVVFPPQWMFPHTGLVGKKPKYFMTTYLWFMKNS
jgi:prolyl 4-hydroxylase